MPESSAGSGGFLRFVFLLLILLCLIVRKVTNFDPGKQQIRTLGGIVAYAMTLLAAGLGMFMLFTRSAQTIVVFISILILLVMAFRVVGSVGLQETISGLKRKYAISNQEKHELATFERLELHFRQAKKFDEWWQAVCFAAGEMDFASSSLPLTNRDGRKERLVWEKDNGDAPPDGIVRMIVPIRDRRAKSSLNIEIQVHTNGSLQSAGRRVALFARLMEEHSLPTLPKSKRSTSSTSAETSQVCD